MHSTDPPTYIDAETEALIPLFAPYCGGVTQMTALEKAVITLVQREMSGERRLTAGRQHQFLLRWNGELAPCEVLSCHIRFPGIPSVAYDFEMEAQHLVSWLMLCEEQALPDSFWRWLLLGELPGGGSQ